MRVNKNLLKKVDAVLDNLKELGVELSEEDWWEDESLIRLIKSITSLKIDCEIYLAKAGDMLEKELREE